jgi:hypothetical protein
MRRLGQAMAVLIVLVVSAGLIHARATPAQKCAAAKQKAAAKRFSAKLKCWQKATTATAGAASADPTCLTTAETKFDAAIAKAETNRGCVANGQTGVIEDAVDTCVNHIVTLTPATPCSGFSFGESCWFLAATAQVSCHSVCAGVGLACDETATRAVAGSGGTLANCGAIIDSLAPATAPNPQQDDDNTPCLSSELGVGCGYAPANPPVVHPATAIRVTAPKTTCAATGVGNCTSLLRRACACH